MDAMKSGRRIECLDGLRGLAALWVLIGHAHILTGFKVPVIGDPELGVDLFIMLSGFLMVFHYQRRKAREPWESPQTWAVFWARRFFRIAPLYYVTLVIALVVGPEIYQARMVIDVFNGNPPQAASRYLDDSLSNYLMHLSFLFGLSPSHAFRTALPDWSIGLEMQFYAALPFIMIVLGRLGWLKGMLVAVGLAVIAALAVHRLGFRFPMPSFLPMKMHIFAAGMLLAGALWMSQGRAYLAFALSALLVLIPLGGDVTVLHESVRVGIVALFFVLVHADRVPGSAGSYSRSVNSVLGNTFFRNLGELSFGAYLIHLLIMQPVIAWLIGNTALSDPGRWLATLIVTIPIVYILSFVGYKFIELPGQTVGKRLTQQRQVAT
ncbi:acyltransferase [Rhizobium lentis]|uniref:acyltransferase family protein n=1 Tax=Rhizobium lentis TaxID=1138194 RepID=UPI001C8392D5|nr:acyltransferase [Rhizobium lentis]MBX5041052.1 acyltransferase [Rhizobium lentis]MBX5054042.1 acyltransferase [Rhizobium lentis]MBX5070246.1 acyltransferase [Rhizobium lentis]MBX5109045.1 acyltransferase [Rhizobium lentis]MBX5114945.1 acyltransferase [Rhizobium lentis]